MLFFNETFSSEKPVSHSRLSINIIFTNVFKNTLVLPAQVTRLKVLQILIIRKTVHFQ